MSLAAAHTAHADAVKDFSTGTKVLVDAGTVVVGAPRTSTSTRQIAKATNTLSFALRAEDLGLKLPIAVNFRGEPLGGGWIKYEIDDVYSTPIDLGHGHYLSRITGRVFMRAVPVRGADSQTYGNTRLAIAGLSYATAYGDWGQYMVPITELDLRGGVPQPALGDFAKAGGTVCSNAKTRTHYPFAISLAGAAKAAGIADILPVGGTVDRAVEMARIDEGFQQQQRITETI